jgi:pSer/pThr/pTyr-binding forkhead associated (FHA) protein
MRQLNKVNPESTAYAPQTSESSEGAADKTVVMRKDTGTAARTPSVVVRQGKEPGRTYDMRKDHVSIGRSRESDIFLEDLAVSRLHATIYRDEMGGYLLRDENSANGTSVNGQRVSECALQEGDEIQLGQTILAFVRR